MTPEQAAKLRAPFAPEQIGRLPKGGTYLSYVGHAATTDRLLQVDPGWTWEPVAFDERGLPRLDENGGLWIRLTVAEVTRLGYGDSGGKKGPNAVKEAIGDAIRNAAMRFGVAIDLWAKEDLTAAHDVPAQPRLSDIQDVKARVWTAAQARGMTVDDLAADFARINEGLPIGDANRDQLEDYGKMLERGAA
jgi:hypothetical protein